MSLNEKLHANAIVCMPCQSVPLIVCGCDVADMKSDTAVTLTQGSLRLATRATQNGRTQWRSLSARTEQPLAEFGLAQTESSPTQSDSLRENPERPGKIESEGHSFFQTAR